MRRVARRLGVFAAAILVLFSVVAYGTGHRESVKAAPKSQAAVTSTPPLLVAPLFIANAEFTSALGLVNGSGIPTYADVILRAPDGAQIAQRRVTFSPHSQQGVDIAAMLESSGATATMGSIVVVPSAELKGPAILSSLSITYANSQQPSFIDEKLALVNSADSQLLRSVADKGEGSPLVAVTSLANTAQNVTIQCLGPNGPNFSKTVNLAPGHTILTEACSSNTSDGANLISAPQASQGASRPATGIALTSDGPPGSFAAFGLAPHQKVGVKYFSSVFFTDPKVLLSPNWALGGVPVGPTTALGGGNYVPELSLANFSAKAVHVTVQYAQTTGGTSSAYQVQVVTVPPGQTREVVLDNLQGDPDLRNSFLVLSDGSPGDISAKLVSQTSLRAAEVELLAKDQLDPSMSALNLGQPRAAPSRPSCSSITAAGRKPFRSIFRAAQSLGSKTTCYNPWKPRELISAT